METARELNVVVVGKTGTGKSTLVNLFANAVTSADLETAEKTKVQLPIPVSFEIKGVEVVAGTNDGNERHGLATSRTLKPKIYTWRSGGTLLRFIDCPGIDDTTGTTMDEQHVANILACISRFHTIHGILLVLKSDENRLTDIIKYQLSQILSCFGQSASECIRFVLTHGGRFRLASQAEEVLQCFLKGLKTSVPLDSENTFCFENDSFRYLVARQYANVHFTESERAEYSETYNESVKEYKRLLESLLATKAHYSVEKAQILHHARQLSPIFSELSKTLNLRLSLLNVEVKQVEGEVQSLSEEIGANMNILEKDEIITEYVEVPKQRTVNVEEEYEEDDIVYDDVGEEVTRYKTENTQETYTEQEPQTVYVPRQVRVRKSRVVTRKVLVNVQRDEVEYYSSDDDSGVPGGAFVGAAIGTALLGPFGLLFGSAAGGAASRRRVQRRRVVTRTVPEWQDRDEVEYYSDYETRSESVVEYRTVYKTRNVPREVSYKETVTKKVPRAVKVKRTREVQKIEVYTELEPCQKTVTVVNDEVQKRIDELEESKSSKQSILEDARKKLGVLNKETLQVLKFTKLLTSHMRENALVCLENDEINQMMKDLLQFEEIPEKATSVEDFMTKLEELCQLQGVGEEVSEAVRAFRDYNSTKFEDVEMKWGYLLDQVLQ